MIEYVLLNDCEEIDLLGNKRFISSVEQLNDLAKDYDICSTDISQIVLDGYVKTTILVGYAL